MAMGLVVERMGEARTGEMTLPCSWMLPLCMAVLWVRTSQPLCLRPTARWRLPTARWRLPTARWRLPLTARRPLPMLGA